MKTKQITCKVLVVGAGISGVAAAISASRNGANTVLVEKHNLPGGVARDCRHRYICGLYPQNTGIAQEIIKGLQKLNPQNQFTTLGRLAVFYFRPQDLTIVLRKLISNEKHLRVFYNCKITGIRKIRNSIASVEADFKSLKLNLKPQVVIEATGNGTIIRLSKAKSSLSPLELRPLAGFTFGVTGLKDKDGLLPIKIPYLLSTAADLEELPVYFKFTNFCYADNKRGGTIKLNLPPADNMRGKTTTEKYSTLIHTYLRKNLPEFKNSRITDVSAMVHEREGLRLAGKHMLTDKEVLSSKKLPGAAAKGFWPIEFWEQKRGQKITYLQPGKFYEIPLDCLKSLNVPNLLATGKCICATSGALASSRAMGTCIYLGESAGKQAAK
jgi:hypothetical protein